MEQLRLLVPDSKWPSVEKALRHTFGAAPLESAQLLTGGLSSALVYRFRIAEQEWVLRVTMQRDGLRDPVREYQCLELASQAGIAPELHYANADDGVSISTFIASVPFSASLLLPLVEAIKAIHALPLFPPLVGFLDGIDGFIQNFQASGVLPAELTTEHFQHYARIQEAYPRHDTDVVSSHNDLNPGNLLYDGHKLWIIDWETAFRNDRYVDLAIAANFFNADEAGEEAMLQLYFDAALSDYQRDRFFLMRQVCRMYNAMIFLNLAASLRSPDFEIDTNMETPSYREFSARLREGSVSHTTPEGVLLFGKVMLNEALTQMKTPRFDAAVRHISQRHRLPL